MSILFHYFFLTRTHTYVYIYIITIAYIEYARFQPYGCGQRKKNLEYLG